MDFSIGDIVRYTGPIVGFGLGKITGFHEYWHKGPVVTVRLIEEIDTYTEWPIDQIELMEE